MIPGWQQEQGADCPYCGEPLTLLVDESAGPQAYVEDCAVCCRPIEVRLDDDGAGGLTLSVGTDSD